VSAKSITVIGNGIVGLCIARALVNNGHSVTVISRDLADEGTSIGNASAIAQAEIMPIASPGLWKRIPGMLSDPLGPLHLRMGHVPKLMPWMYRFLRACRPENYAKGIAALSNIMEPVIRDHHGMLDDINGKHLLNGEGTLYVYRSEEARARDAHAWRIRKEHGIELFALDREGIRQHEPTLSDAAQAGYFSPNWATYADPKELLILLAAHLRERGVTFVQAEVDRVESANGKVAALHTKDGQRHLVDHLVVAGGAWSGRLSKQLGEGFPIEADRGYNTTLPNPGVDMRMFVTFVEDSFVASPLSIGLRIGGAVEMGGVDAPPNYARSDALLTLAKRYLPDINTDGGTKWMGHRPSTPDSIPVISTSATRDNVCYAFGHGHLGLTLSVTTARLIADMIDGRDPGIDMTPYRIDRYR
jgi:D-amino-acid dehydrogenase